MTKFERVRSKKRKRWCWRVRFKSPLTGRPTHNSYWVTEERIADAMHKEHLQELEARLAGVHVGKSWRTPWPDLVARFLKEAPISSPKRRSGLRAVLDRNDLGLAVAADLNDVARLNGKAQRLIEAGRSPAYVVKWVQRTLKQVSRWAFEVGLLPTDPLLRWRRIPGYVEHNRRAFRPEEVRAILDAARELDHLNQRQYSSELVLRVLVVGGNRPQAVFDARVADLEDDRIRLAPGNGKKLNGACTLPGELVAELKLRARGRGTGASLLVSAEGRPLDVANFRKRDFQSAAALAFVKLNWPSGHPFAREVEPWEVAHVLSRGEPRGFDGPPPTDPAKIDARKNHIDAVKKLAEELRPAVDAKIGLSGEQKAGQRRERERPFYAFIRHTHETLASLAGVHPHCIDAQIGHRAKGVGESHYLDNSQLNPSASSQAVYGLIARKPASADAEGQKVLRMAAGAERDWTGPEQTQKDTSSDLVGEHVAGKAKRTGKSTSKMIRQVQADQEVILERATGIGPATFGLGSRISSPMDRNGQEMTGDARN